MKFTINVPFECPPDMTEHLQRVFNGEYDVPEIFIPAPKILDLGANCGAFSVWATHRYPGCDIDAYEPHPETFSFLKKNASLFPNIKCHNYGIGNPGLRILNDGPNNCGERSFHAPQGAPGTGIHLEVKSPEILPAATILKLDVEGCEMEVLSPLIENGARFALILLEYHNHQLRREVDRLLRDYDLVGGEVQSFLGRGISKYLHHSLTPEIK